MQKEVLGNSTKSQSQRCGGEEYRSWRTWLVFAYSVSPHRIANVLTILSSLLCNVPAISRLPPLRNEELRKSEESLPRLKEGDLEEASRLYKAKTGVGCDGVHPKVPPDLTKGTRGTFVEFLEKVDQSGKWPQQACTTMFFLIPANVTSERPIALMPTLIRS